MRRRRWTACSLLVATLAACSASTGGAPGGDPDGPGAVATPTFSPPGGTVAAGTAVTVRCATPGATVYSGQTEPPAGASATFTVNASGTWYAQARLGGASSAVASATYAIATATPPAAPTGLTATALSASSIGLGWTDRSTDETAFYVERAPDAGGAAGAFAQVAALGSNATSWIDTGLASETTYWYRVRAHNGAGDSGYTASASARTSAGGGAFAITTRSCPRATQGQSYSCTIAVTGGTTPYAFTVASATGLAPLPEGMSLDASTGVVSSARVGGQGGYDVRIHVADAGGHAADLDLTFQVDGSNAYLADIFPAGSIFHHRVDAASTGLPVDRSPAAPIYSGYQSSRLRVFFGAYTYEGLPSGIPAIDVPYDQASVPVATTVYQSYFTAGPIPPYAPVEGTAAAGGDMHVLVYRRAGGGRPPALYEMWQGAYLGAQGWTDSSNALWPDVSGNDLTQQGKGTSDAAGLPIAPLILNADEVIGTGTPTAPNGTVRHPVRFTTNRTLNYWVWPGTACAGVGSCNDAQGRAIETSTMLSQSSPPSSCTGMTGPMGEIYRLKASVPTPACAASSPQAAIVIQGFRDYGIILADNGMTGGLIGTPDARWNDDDLSCLTQLTLGDFEPVDVSSLMVSAASGQTRR